MVSFYHGSRLRFFAEVAARPFTEVPNFFRKRVSRAKPDPLRTEQERLLRGQAKQHDWPGARVTALRIAEVARARGDARWLHVTAGALERLQVYDRAYAVRSEGHRLIDDPGDRTWTGDIDFQKHLVITPFKIDRSSLSSAIQYAPLIKLASERVGSCTVYLAPRLQSLFQRSFPDVEFRSEELLASDHHDRAVVFAGLESLPAIFATDTDKISAAFVPLRADDRAVSAFREKYREGRLPLIGIAWGSMRGRKEVPAFADWAALLKDFPARFVSVQYGPVDAAVKKIGRAAGRPLIYDKSVDQLTDMDTFAAQVASLDAVVTISNTGAHLAGALAVPMIVLLDDTFRLLWPVNSDRMPWYPEAALIRKTGRPWPTVLTEARTRLQRILRERKDA